jgi:AraC-like DNA-binding protein
MTCALGTGSLEEQLHKLMGQLLQVHFNVYKEVETLPAARPATREELYRRVQYARDYAAALFDTPVTLDDMACVACLSPNHLLRTFKQVFQQTPHQFITTIRLEEAQRLLRCTDNPVTDICYAVGFESIGAFGWLFRRRFGVSPGEYRRQSR